MLEVNRHLTRARGAGGLGGVIYRPETELQSHYAQASLPEQLDAWVGFDTTEAVTPLGDAGRREGGAGPIRSGSKGHAGAGAGARRTAESAPRTKGRSGSSGRTPAPP